MRRVRGSLVLLSIYLITSGCVSQIEVEALNDGLLGCSTCTFQVASEPAEGSFVRLGPGFELAVEAIDLMVLAQPPHELFTLQRSGNAMSPIPPAISTYRFLVPWDDEQISRSEAFFVAFLLSASHTDDGSDENPGRQYSELLPPSSTDQEIKDVIRKYTQSMKLVVHHSDNSSEPATMSMHVDAHCSSAGKAGSTVAPPFLSFDTHDENVFATLGKGPDWLYAELIDEFKSNGAHSSVIEVEPAAVVGNSLFNFKYNYPVYEAVSGKTHRLESCESYASFAGRVGKAVIRIERSCRYKPDELKRCNGSFFIGVGEKPADVVGFGRRVFVSNADLKNLVPNVGDRVVLR